MTVAARPSVDLGRSSAGPEAAFDADLRMRAARARAFIPSAHLAEFDAVLDHVRAGHHGWTMLWSSLSPAQKGLMSSLGSAGGEALHIVTRGSGSEVGTGRGVGFRTSTVRALVKFGLLDWAEPALGADWVVTASAKGRSLLAAMRARS